MADGKKKGGKDYGNWGDMAFKVTKPANKGNNNTKKSTKRSK